MSEKRRRKRTLISIAVVAAVLAMLLLSLFWPKPDDGVATDAKIDAALREGRVVLVNIVADWSIVARTHERQILSDVQMKQLIDDGKVVAMRVNVTERNANVPSSLGTKRSLKLPASVVLSDDRRDRPTIFEKDFTIDAVVDEVVKAVAN